MALTKITSPLWYPPKLKELTNRRLQTNIPKSQKGNKICFPLQTGVASRLQAYTDITTGYLHFQSDVRPTSVIQCTSRRAVLCIILVFVHWRCLVWLHFSELWNYYCRTSRFQIYTVHHFSIITFTESLRADTCFWINRCRSVRINPQLIFSKLPLYFA